MAKNIYIFIKFILQTILVIVVCTAYSISVLAYILILYPFRILLSENINSIKLFKTKYGINKIIFLNPYYIFLSFKNKHINRINKLKEEKSNFIIFFNIKFIISIIPIYVYSIILYPINILIMSLCNLIFKNR